MFHICALQAWISWIICRIVQTKTTHMAWKQKESRREQPPLLEFIVRADWETSERLMAKFRSNILSNSAFKVQLNLISSQRPLDVRFSFTFIFSCYLWGIRNLSKVRNRIDTAISRELLLNIQLCFSSTSVSGCLLHGCGEKASSS